MHQRQYVGQWDKGTLGQMVFALSGVSVVGRQMVLYELLYILLIYILIIYIIIIISGSVLIGKSKIQMSLCPTVPLSPSSFDFVEFLLARHSSNKFWLCSCFVRHFNI